MRCAPVSRDLTTPVNSALVYFNRRRTSTLRRSRFISTAANQMTINAIMMRSCVANFSVQPWLPLSQTRYQIENGANSFASLLLFHMEAKGKFEFDANSRVTPLLRFPVE